MSFILRDLFSEDDEDSQAEWSDSDMETGSRESAPPNSSPPPVEGETYLVSELLPFIPPAIVASEGIPMEKEIIIPLEESGSTDVRLSTIFQSCPELFDAEITPLNDSTVTLPAKMGNPEETSKVGTSPFDAPATPFGAPGFGLPDAAEADAAAGDPKDNPFWSPESDSGPVEGFSSLEMPGADSAIPSGFSDSSPAEVLQKKEEPEEEAPLPEKKSAKTSEAPMGGFEPASPPKSGNAFESPAEMAPPAEKTGFSENPFDSTESFSTLFSKKAEEDADLPFPSTGGDDATWGAMFETDADETSEGAQKSEFSGFGDMMKQEGASGEATVPEATIAPEEDAIEEGPPEPAPKEEIPSGPPASGLSGVSTRDKTPVPPEKEPASFPEEKVYNTLRETSPASQDATVKVEEEKLAPMAPAMPGEMEVSVRDLEFRALFSSDETFSLAKVAREVVAFEGVCACALATPAKLVQASQNEQSRLGDEAREMVDAIRNLAKLTGLPEARAFTLQTDRGTVSLFLEGDCCVTVNHLPTGFGPGVREKLILIARNIHKLQE